MVAFTVENESGETSETISLLHLPNLVNQKLFDCKNFGEGFKKDIERYCWFSFELVTLQKLKGTFFQLIFHRENSGIKLLCISQKTTVNREKDGIVNAGNFDSYRKQKY